MDEGCTCICLTGNKVVGPAGLTGNWAITGKNSDSSDVESPVYVPSQTLNITYMKTHGGSPVTESFTTNAYTGVYRTPSAACTLPSQLTRVGQGINEYGLACSYAHLTGLASVYPTQHTADNSDGYPNTGGVFYSAREFTTGILLFYKTVAEVLDAVVDPTSLIGPENRSHTECTICVVDRYGYGAVIEVETKKAIYYRLINAAYQTDNVVRIWGPYYSDVGTYGGEIPNTTKMIAVANAGNRTILMEESYNKYKDVNGAIDYRDMRHLLTYVQSNRLEGDVVFNTDVNGEWDIVHSDTQVSGFAVTGDERYNGIFNAYFVNSGVPAFLGPYLPLMTLGGQNSTLPATRATFRPINGAGLWNTGDASYMEGYVEDVMAPAALYAANQYYPDRVRAVMSASDTATDYVYQKWESFLKTIQYQPTATEMQNYITDWQQTAVSIYKNIISSEDFETFGRYNGTSITTPASSSISFTDTTNPYHGSNNMKITVTSALGNSNCNIYKTVSGDDIWVAIHNLKFSALPPSNGYDLRFITGSQSSDASDRLFNFGLINHSGTIEWLDIHRTSGAYVSVHEQVTPTIAVDTNYNVLAHMVRHATAGSFEVWVAKEGDDMYKVVNVSSLVNSDYTFSYVSLGLVNSDPPIMNVFMDRIIISKSEIDFDRWNQSKVSNIDPWKISKIGGVDPKNIRTFGGVTRNGLWYT